MIAIRGSAFILGLCVAICVARGATTERMEIGTRSRSETGDRSVAMGDYAKTDSRITGETVPLPIAETLASRGAASVPSNLNGLSASPTMQDSTNLIAAIRAMTIHDAKDAVPALARLAQSTEDPAIAQESWKALGRLADPSSLPVMLFVLETPRDNSFRNLLTQVAAMNALAEIVKRDGGPERVIEQFEHLCTTSTPVGKQRMIEILQKLDTYPSRNMLYRMMGDGDPEVQRYAVSAISRADYPQIVDTLQRFLAGNDMALRKEAILALGRCKGLAATPALIEFLNSKEPAVKVNAKWALLNITGRSFESAANAKLWLEARRSDSEDRFKILLDLVKNGPESLTPLAIEEMGNLVLTREKVEVALRPYLNHRDYRVRAAVCHALGQGVPSTRVFGALISKLVDSSEIVRATAWRSLQAMTGQRLPKDYEAWSQWLRKRG